MGTPDRFTGGLSDLVLIAQTQELTWVMMTTM
jgi:hypothetical protein